MFHVGQNTLSGSSRITVDHDSGSAHERSHPHSFIASNLSYQYPTYFDLCTLCWMFLPHAMGCGMSNELSSIPVDAALGPPLPPSDMPIQIEPRVSPAHQAPSASPSPLGMLPSSMIPPVGMSPSCALCKKQPANRACRACKADLDTPTTYCCSSDCRRAHWSEHKERCATGASRLALFRAAYIARSLFLNFLTHTFTSKVLSVQCDNDILSIALEGLKVGVLYTSFPDSLSLSEEDKAAALSFSACSSSMAYMWDIVSLLFLSKSPDTARY